MAMTRGALPAPADAAPAARADAVSTRTANEMRINLRMASSLPALVSMHASDTDRRAAASAASPIPGSGNYGSRDESGRPGAESPPPREPLRIEDQVDRHFVGP